MFKKIAFLIVFVSSLAGLISCLVLFFNQGMLVLNVTPKEGPTAMFVAKQVPNTFIIAASLFCCLLLYLSIDYFRQFFKDRQTA